MFCAAFIFEPGAYDTRFHELNALIDRAARATEGFLGSESWQARDGKACNAIYYWESLDALKQFSLHPDHIEAKRQYTRWYTGYHVVISQVLRSYGDGVLAHVTPNEHSERSRDDA